MRPPISRATPLPPLTFTVSNQITELVLKLPPLSLFQDWSPVRAPPEKELRLIDEAVFASSHWDHQTGPAK